MLAKRIIPCLDVDDGVVKKGVNFDHLKNVGDPISIAKKYAEQGADELVLLDITATNEKRATITEVVNNVAKNVFVPFTVGGGIDSIEAMQKILKAGADKISINTKAVNDPQIIQKGAQKFGSQCIVLAIDTKWDPKSNNYQVYTNGGKEKTSLDAIEWAKKGVQLGAGELLVTSMDCDGTEKGYDIDLYRHLNSATNVPIIASGGSGKINDFKDVFQQANVSGALAASLFHYDQLTIPAVKKNLKQNGVVIR